MKSSKRIKQFFRRNRKEYEYLMGLIARDETAFPSPMLSILYAISYSRNGRSSALNDEKAIAQHSCERSKDEHEEKEFSYLEIHSAEDRRESREYLLA